MKLLIGGSSTFMFHLQEFAKKLNEFGVETKLVYDADYADGFPSRKISTWFKNNKKFQKLVDEFKPDAIFIDREKHFGIASIEKNIPLIVLLRGHYWSELEWYKKTIYKKFPKNIIIKKWDKIARKIFQEAEIILPICKYLEDVTKEFVPNKKTDVFFEGIDSAKWYPVQGMTLKHPCVGLVQRANWWGKTSEMLVLKKVLEKMPNVNFYWAGDGPFRQKIIDELGKYKNFHWLGKLEYPDKVREFLTEIDVYALISGIDMSPLTLQEAQLMEKPVIATNVGGIPELMKDGETGFLIEKGNPTELFEKLSLLLDDQEKSKEMGKKGRKFVMDNFNLDKICNDFLNHLKKHGIGDI